LGHLFRKQGDNLVTFEIMELEKDQKMEAELSLKEADDFVMINDT
jgi:hypothetical protein